MLTTLSLVLALLANVPASERQPLVLDAAIASGLCVDGADADGGPLCSDGVSDVWDRLAEEGIEVPSCDPRDIAADCWSVADSLDPIAGI